MVTHRLGAVPGNGETLVGCIVAPGFDFDGFELADREPLPALYPEYAAVIRLLTR